MAVGLWTPARLNLACSAAVMKNTPLPHSQRRPLRAIFKLIKKLECVVSTPKNFVLNEIKYL